MYNLLEILIFTLKNFTKLPILRYLGICNVLHIWHIRAIPTYRVYRLYDRPGKAEAQEPTPGVLQIKQRVRQTILHRQQQLETCLISSYAANSAGGHVDLSFAFFPLKLCAAQSQRPYEYESKKIIHTSYPESRACKQLCVMESSADVVEHPGIKPH